MREGTALPLGPVVAHTGEMTGDEIEVRLYPDERGRVGLALPTENGILGLEGAVGEEGATLQIDPRPAGITIGLPHAVSAPRGDYSG